MALSIAIACMGAQSQAVIVVTEPWVRPGAANASVDAYMRLMSSTDTTLIGVRSDAAASVVLRSPAGKSVAPLVLTMPANEVVKLHATGYRLVLQKLSRGLRTDDRVPMVLTVRNADGSVQDIAIDAEVRLHSPTDDHMRPHKHQ